MPEAKSSASYVTRNGTDCVMLGELEEQPCWGIVRFSKHECYLCEGHRTPPDYKPEAPKPTANELEERRQQAQEAVEAEERAWAAAVAEWGVPRPPVGSHWTLARWVEHQASRWFRPLLEGIDQVGVGFFWTDLSDVLLVFLHSSIGEGIRCGDGSEAVNKGLLAMGRQATAEVRRRKLVWPEGAYDLELAPEWTGIIDTRNPQYTDPFGPKVLQLGFHHLSAQEVQLLYGCAAVVADFSTLERGVRQCVMYVCHETERELEKREVPITFLMDLQC